MPRRPKLIFSNGELEVESFSLAGGGITAPDLFEDVQFGDFGIFILGESGLRFVPYTKIEAFGARFVHRKRGRPRVPPPIKSTAEIFEYVKRKPK